MSISIITRAYKTSELKRLVNYLNSNCNIKHEIIGVCNVNDEHIQNANIIIENSNRFQAMITGIKNANYDKILFLDSDQEPENGLLNELISKDNDMIIIPEKSINNSFTSRCLNDWRYRTEALAAKNPNPNIQVIPRFYKRKYLINAIYKMPSVFYKIVFHEDSVLYYEVFQETKNVAFSSKHIYNYDPSLVTFIKKSFFYGKSQRCIDKASFDDIPANIRILIQNLNRNTLNVKELGIGKGYITQAIRGLSYEIGRIIG